MTDAYWPSPDLAAPGLAETRRGRPDLLNAVFERFPSGIVVVDSARRVVASNAAVEELLQIRADGVALKCCDLFGCGRPGTALAGRCLSELALAADEAVPELFLEPPTAVRGAVWVRAASLYPERSHVIVQVRGAHPDERPPEPLQKAELMVYTLGRLELHTPQGPVDAEWLSQRAGQLFKFLVTERHHYVPIEVIAEAVWPHASNRTANTVRHCMHGLRAHLEPAIPRAVRSQFILVQNGAYRLNLDCVWVDADEFERTLSTGMRAFARGDTATAINRFESAVRMYRGDYLADDRYWEWAFAERERLRDVATVPLRALAELRADAPDVALAYVQRLADMEPLDHAIQRQLIELLMKHGRRSRAVRQYHAFRVRLMRSFNEQPSFELSDLIGHRDS